MQTRWQSVVEKFWDTLLAFAISVGAQLLIFPLYGLRIGLFENVQIVFWFTLISFARGYLVRRLFNHWHRPRGN